jgi:hypothetical protein
MLARIHVRLIVRLQSHSWNGRRPEFRQNIGYDVACNELIITRGIHFRIPSIAFRLHGFRTLSIDGEFITWMDGFMWIEAVPEDKSQHGNIESMGD